MNLVIYIGYPEPYMLFCQNLYAFYFVCTRQNGRRVSVGSKKILIIPDHKEINGQLRQNSMASCRRNELCQRPKTS